MEGNWEIIGGPHLGDKGPHRGDNWELWEASGRQLGDHIWNKLGHHWGDNRKTTSVRQPETTR